MYKNVFTILRVIYIVTYGPWPRLPRSDKRPIFSKHNSISLECHNTSNEDLFVSIQNTDTPKFDSNLGIRSYKTILQCGVLQKATDLMYVVHTIMLLWPSLNFIWGLNAHHYCNLEHYNDLGTIGLRANLKVETKHKSYFMMFEDKRLNVWMAKKKLQINQTTGLLQ